MAVKFERGDDHAAVRLSRFGAQPQILCRDLEIVAVAHGGDPVRAELHDAQVVGRAVEQAGQKRG